MLEKSEGNIRPTGSNPFVVKKEKPQKEKKK
jgi:hypothetical protein